MEEEPLHIVDVKTEPFILKDKCAEVYRNNNLGTYTFLCFACGETLDSTTAVDSIFKHLDTHYHFEGHDNFQGKQEAVTVDEQINPIVHIQTVFLDVNKPIIENNTLAKIEILDSFNCDICENIYTTKSDLIAHLQVHTTKLTENIVRQSNINSENKGEISTIEDIVVDPPQQCNETTKKISKFQCKICFKVMKNGRSLTAHCVIHLENRYKCKECDKVLENAKSLRDHYRVHTNPKFKCDQCGTVFKNETLLKDHNCGGLKELHKCDQCDNKYRSKSNLTVHRQKKHQLPLRSYTCDICNETFHNIRNFAKHIRSHSSTFIFKCNVCDKAFKSRSTYASHKHVHNPDGAKKHVCNICNMQFRQISNYKTHLLRHKGEKPFECTICKKRLYTSSELADHVRRIHTGERKFQCDQCGKNFFSASALTQHKKYHTKEKSHKCQFCDEKFFTTGRRKEHERIHTGEKPYKCDGCDYAFRTCISLKQHAILHTGAKPYSCRICGMKFAQNAGKRCHERNKHGC